MFDIVWVCVLMNEKEVCLGLLLVSVMEIVLVLLLVNVMEIVLELLLFDVGCSSGGLKLIDSIHVVTLLSLVRSENRLPESHLEFGVLTERSLPLSPIGSDVDVQKGMNFLFEKSLLSINVYTTYGAFRHHN